MTEELCHVRCISCGKVLANKWDQYQNLLGQGVKIGDALTRIGLTRYCCRTRMMNPFKVPMRSDRQIDPRDTGMNAKTETLTIATKDPNPPMAPLQDMNTQAIGGVPTNVPGYTVVPLNPDIAGINLPAIPDVALPALPAPGAKIVPEDPTNIIRTYNAW